MDKRAYGMSGMMAAAGIGLALVTGPGISAAEPSASDGAGPGASSSTGTGGAPKSEAGQGTSPSATMHGNDAGAAASPSSTATTDDAPHPHASTDPAHANPSDADADADTDTDADADADTDADPVEQPHPTPVKETSEAAEHGGSRPAPTAAPPTPHRPVPQSARSDASTGADDVVAETSQPVGADIGQAVDVQQPVITSGPHPVDVTQDAESVPQPAVSEEVLAPVGLVERLLSALTSTDAPAPVETPSLWVVLAWVRRQLVDTVVAITGGQPTTSAPMSAATTVTTINVKDYGAVGDGITDDSAAIKAAQAALTSGGRLYFPEGDYRFAQQHPDGNAAVLLKGLSNVTVEFASGARLLMDNLDADGHGTSHGIRVEGTASHVTLLNPTIEWVVRPSARSFGDGLSILGYPSDSPPPSGWTGSTGIVEFVSIVNARVVNAPQSGAVIMGASDVTVTNFTAIGTLADGLHFNANRRVTVDGLFAQNTGDDGLAFVTYYDPTQPWTYGPGDGPFNQAGVGEWNNGGSVASHITVTGGAANGVRVQGGYDITIDDVTVTDTKFGLHLNSAKAVGPGDWTSLASRDIHISNVTIDGAQTGIVLATNNIDGTESSMWWDFAGSSITDVVIRGSKNWSLAVETPTATTSKYAGITLRNIYAESMVADGPTVGGNGGILLASLRDSVIDGVHLLSDHPSDIIILGAPLIRDQLSVADLPSSNLTIDGLVLDGPGRILFQDIAGLDVGSVESHGADGSAVVLYRVGDSSFDDITAYLPGRGTGPGYGVQVLQVYDLHIDDITVTTDDHVGSSFWAVELGGGNPAGIAGENVRIENVTYVSGRDDTDSDIVVQGGPYGPVNWLINANWRHEGEAVPQWRHAVLGDVSPV